MSTPDNTQPAQDTVGTDGRQPAQRREPVARHTVQSHCVEVLLDHEGNVAKMRVCRNLEGRPPIHEETYTHEHPALDSVVVEATEVAAQDRHDCFLGMTEQRIPLDVPVEPGEEQPPSRSGWLAGEGEAVHPVGVPPAEL
jgi:hypothetical protein